MASRDKKSGVNTAASARTNLPVYSQQRFTPIASSSSSAGSQSKKRKTMAKNGAAPAEQKYYAVRVGFKTGVFNRWSECQQYITGFSGAKFKSFTSHEDAVAFVEGRDPPKPQDLAKPIRYYGVAVGRVPGVYTDWAVAHKQIVGWKMPRYRKFDTREDAEAFVRAGPDAPMPEPSSLDDGFGDDDDDDEEEDPPVAAKKVKCENAAPAVLFKPKHTIVYTDGSSRGNGKAGAVAGYGVWFGPNDPRNISERLEGNPQTNQRAELTACLRALEAVPVDEDLEIRTDSQYSINCVTDWYRGWQRKGWLTATNKPVKNVDLVQAIRAEVDKRDEAGADTIFTWVKGHANEKGNVAADHLAVQGSQK